MNNPLNILLVGVGGQGTILASKVLASVAQSQGFDVKMSEIHGMAQRGGSVVTQVRIGTKVYSPLIEIGQADYIVAFEKLEALRWLHYLKPEGRVIVNNQEIEPMSVITGAAQYPDDVLERLQSEADVLVVDALGIAQEIGNIRTVNIVLMGALSKELDIPEQAWLAALEENIKPKYIEVNKRAFAEGRQAV